VRARSALKDVPVNRLRRDVVHLWGEMASSMPVHEGSLALRAWASWDIDRVLCSVDICKGVWLLVGTFVGEGRGCGWCD
jgi:hypothetical protein